MEFNYFDLIIITVVLLLGLKGIINGFFKELFGLIGIIGGIFVASRFDQEVGTVVNDALFHFESNAAVTFTGFLMTLILFWVLMITLGLVLKKLLAVSGLGILDRIMGFVIGSGKFFLIASVIVYAVFNIKIVRDNFQETIDSSLILPMMIKTGNVIMQIDPADISEDANTTLNETVETVKKSIDINVSDINAAATQLVKQSPELIMEEVKRHVEQNATQQEAAQ